MDLSVQAPLSMESLNVMKIFCENIKHVQGHMCSKTSIYVLPYPCMLSCSVGLCCMQAVQILNIYGNMLLLWRLYALTVAVV